VKKSFKRIYNGINRGLIDNILNIFSDLWFEILFGVKTMKLSRIANLDIGFDSKLHGFDYYATRSRPFKKILKKVKNTKNSVFVDIGSGKGKCLILADIYGFKKSVGVEFSKELVDISKKNVKKYLNRKGKNFGEIEIYHEDASTFIIKEDYNIFYLFNPFDEKICNAVLNNILESLKHYPREAWIIYCGPLFRNLFISKEVFQVSSYKFGSVVYDVYSYKL
jgi:16S rRNA G966 N2-methylase RsmD